MAHMLLVTEAQGGDAGQYRCTARNEVFFLPHFLLTFLSLFHISNGNSNDKDVLEDDYDDDLSIL